MRDDIQGVDFTKKNNTTLGITQEVVAYQVADPEENVRDNIALLELCNGYWQSLRDFRNRRARSRKYYRGDQWSDTVRNPETGDYTTEEDYIKAQGKVPLKQNQIRQLVKNLIGQYRSNPTKSNILSRAREDAKATEMLTVALDAVKTVNNTDELDARIFEEFAISGAPIQKVSYRYWHTRNIEDGYVQNVNPSRIFFNSDLSDPRLHDLNLIGEIIDTTIDNIISEFAQTKEQEARIRNLYSSQIQRGSVNATGLSSSNIDNLSFLTSSEIGKARLFEIWKLEGRWVTMVHDPLDATYKPTDYTQQQIAAFNDERVKLGLSQGATIDQIPLLEADQIYENFWEVKYLTPSGHTLWKGETPYDHGSHPYALTLYPLLDGEVWGFVEDIIDQQRYINRLIIMMDFITSASAKGVLMVPEGSIPDNMTPEQFSSQWRRFDGVIVYKPIKGGDLPKQIAANSVNIGIKELLSLQMQLIQDISGVQSAIQGQAPDSGTPANRYAMETRNASINSVDYMLSFGSFKQMRDMKLLKTITQYYDKPRFLAVAGRAYSTEAKKYDPETIRGFDYDVVVAQGTDTPIYRNMVDDILMQLLDKQQIDIGMFLQETSLPFADKLLEAMKLRQQQAVEGGVPNAPLPAAAQGMIDQANPQAVALGRQALGANPQEPQLAEAQ